MPSASLFVALTVHSSSSYGPQQLGGYIHSIAAAPNQLSRALKAVTCRISVCGFFFLFFALHVSRYTEEKA